MLSRVYPPSSENSKYNQPSHKIGLIPAPISREAYKSEPSSNEVTMSPYCTLCEVASHMKARNVERGSRRHHSCSGMPKYKTWLERRGGGIGGENWSLDQNQGLSCEGPGLFRAASLQTCWCPQHLICTHHLPFAMCRTVSCGFWKASGCPGRLGWTFPVLFILVFPGLLLK